MTATQLIQRALREICELRPGQATSTDVNAEGLIVLNEMIESWLLDRLLVPALVAASYTLTVNDQAYTIGPSGADFTAARPTKIEYANILLNNVSPVVRVPMRVVTDVAEWANIAVQVLQSGIPSVLYNDQAFPNSTLNIWPAPSYAYQMELYTWQQITAFADLTTNYTFRPGYSRALRLNLAMELMPSMVLYLKGKPQLDLVAAQARESLTVIKSYNAPDHIISCDPAFTPNSKRGGWNYMTGDYNR